MKINSIRPSLLAATLVLLATSLRAELRIAPAPDGAPISEARYRVRLRAPGGEWQRAPVYAFFQQHDYNKALTAESEFVTFESSGAVEVEVESVEPIAATALRPLRHAATVTRKDRVLTFQMNDATRQLCLELNGDPRHPSSKPADSAAPRASTDARTCP